MIALLPIPASEVKLLKDIPATKNNTFAVYFRNETVNSTLGAQFVPNIELRECKSLCCQLCGLYLDHEVDQLEFQESWSVSMWLYTENLLS